MRKLRSRRTVRVMVTVVACALVLAVPASLSAQKRKPIPSGPVKPPTPDSPSSSTPNLRTADQAALEMSVLMSRRTLIGDLERERHRLTAQLAQDLEQLEQLNTERIVPLISAKQLDYRELAQLSADVKTHATRIKFYSPIALVDRTGERIRYEAEPNELGKMLPQLSRTIKSFVGNPVFRISAPDDGTLRSVAAHDLESIIKLSDVINRVAKRLSKPLVANK